MPGSDGKDTVAPGNVSPDDLSLIVPETVKFFLDWAKASAGTKKIKKAISCFVFCMLKDLNCESISPEPSREFL